MASDKKKKEAEAVAVVKPAQVCEKQTFVANDGNSRTFNSQAEADAYKNTPVKSDAKPAQQPAAVNEEKPGGVTHD